MIGQFADLRRDWAERGGRVFLRRSADNPVHTMSSQNNLKVTRNYYEKNSYHKEYKTFIEASYTNNIPTGERATTPVQGLWVVAFQIK